MLLLTQARSPTKSGWDSAVWEGWCGNPSGSRPNSFGRQHLTFDKGGKRDGAKQGIVRFWKFRAARGITVFSRINAFCAFLLQLQ